MISIPITLINPAERLSRTSLTENGWTALCVCMKSEGAAGKLRTNGEHTAKLCYNGLWNAVRRIASRSTLALSGGSIAASNNDEGRLSMDRRLADLLVA